MKQQSTLAASARTETGKGVARALRRAGKIPAVIYGRGREPEALELEAAATTRVISHASGSTIIDVQVDDRAPVQALLREVQRNPIRPEVITHIDFYEIHAGEEIEVDVPIHLQGNPDGVRNFGGVLDHNIRELHIRVLPRNIPESIDIDVTDLGIGQAIYVRDIEIGEYEVLTDADQPVCSVVAARAAEPEPGEVEEAEEVAEPEVIGREKEDEDTETDTAE